jgi:hypothetical protein
VALFSGGAHPGVNIQALAQNAAQNVLRRQRMRKLLQAGAAAAGAAGGGGVTRLMRSSMEGRGMGVRGHVQRPGFDAQTLAAMLRGAANQATLPGGGLSANLGGMFSMGGGGYDFGAIADPNDPSQSPRSIDPTQVTQNAVAPVGITDQNYGPPDNPYVPGSPGEPGINSGPSQGTNINAGPVLPGGDPTNVALPPGTHGWIPLGGGMFYDPVNDIVRGGSSPSLNPIDSKF